MSSTKIAGIVAGLVLSLVAVAGGGFYLGQHYRLVPVEPPTPPVFQPPVTPEAVAPPVLTPPVPPSFPKASAKRGEGPFSYKFSRGEKLGYVLEAEVTGAGTERDLGVGDIGMRFDSQFDLDTEAVDHDGVANLKLQFNQVDMVGRFMGDEVRLHHGEGSSEPEARIINQMKSDRQPPTEDTPQMDFFKTPIRMSVGPDGEVLGVQGVPGFEDMLVPESIVAAVGFPEENLVEGQQWESDFRLPIPGFDVAVDAKALNTFEGYIDLGGHSCAVIRQVLDSSQVNGQLSSPSGVLGEMMKFTMPKFTLAGENTIYFDTAIGKMRQANMDFTVGLEIGQELDAVKNLIGAFGQQLDDLEGNSSRKSSAKTKSKDEPLMDLGFNVVSTLSLQEDATP